MKRSISTGVCALALVASSLMPMTASAQMVVTDPGAIAVAQAAVAKQIQQFVTEGKTLAANNTQITKLGTQINNQITQIKAAQSTLAYQKQQISSVMQNAGLPMVQKLLQNNTLMASQAKLDPQITAEFQKALPGYTPGADYSTYVKTLLANTQASEAQAMGVGSDAVKSEATVGTALEKLANNPVNELQSLQEMVQIGKIQSGQLDKLVKIQSAMMKNMAYEWNAQQRLAQGTSGGQGISNDTMSAMTICESSFPFFSTLPLHERAQLLSQCQSAAASRSTVNQQPAAGH